MKDLSMLQLLAGTVGVMVLVISATFAGYWNLFGKKHFSLVKKQIPRTANASLPQGRTRVQQ